MGVVDIVEKDDLVNIFNEFHRLKIQVQAKERAEKGRRRRAEDFLLVDLDCLDSEDIKQLFYQYIARVTPECLLIARLFQEVEFLEARILVLERRCVY